MTALKLEHCQVRRQYYSGKRNQISAYQQNQLNQCSIYL